MVKRIRLHIEAPGGVERSDWPVTQGVPFPDKVLKRGAPVRVVDSEGTILPTQFVTLATWDKDREFVKWLLTDF